MGGIGSGRKPGSVNKRRHLRIAPVSDAIMIDLWQLFRDKLLNGNKATYEIEHKDKTVQIEVKGDFDAYIINGTRVEFDINKVKRHRYYCPSCNTSVTQLYIYNDKLGCRHCLHLYPETEYHYNNSTEKLARVYGKHKANYEKALAFYKVYEESGMPWPITRGLFDRPYKWVKRLEKMKYRLTVWEARLWSKAADGLQVTGDIELSPLALKAELAALPAIDWNADVSLEDFK